MKAPSKTTTNHPTTKFSFCEDNEIEHFFTHDLFKDIKSQSQQRDMLMKMKNIKNCVLSSSRATLISNPNCISYFKAADDGEDLILMFFSWTTEWKKHDQRLLCLPCLVHSAGQFCFRVPRWLEQEKFSSKEDTIFERATGIP